MKRKIKREKKKQNVRKNIYELSNVKAHKPNQTSMNIPCPEWEIKTLSVRFLYDMTINKSCWINPICHIRFDVTEFLDFTRRLVKFKIKELYFWKSFGEMFRLVSYITYLKYVSHKLNFCLMIRRMCPATLVL